jgi:hypothetical protein
MVVGFTTTYEISTKVVSSNPAHGKVYSIQHYVIKFLITTWICTYHKSVRSSRGDRTIRSRLRRSLPLSYDHNYVGHSHCHTITTTSVTPTVIRSPRLLLTLLWYVQIHVVIRNFVTIFNQPMIPEISFTTSKSPIISISSCCLE